MVADIVKYGRQLNDLSQKGNVAIHAKVLVTDDGLTDCIGLVLGRPKVSQDIEGFETTVELKGHAGGSDVLFSGANVVKQGSHGKC